MSLTVTDSEEIRLLEKFRASKKMGHADGEWSIKNGKMIKLWVTEKIDLERPSDTLREGDK